MIDNRWQIGRQIDRQIDGRMDGQIDRLSVDISGEISFLKFKVVSSVIRRVFEGSHEHSCQQW